MEAEGDGVDFVRWATGDPQWADVSWPVRVLAVLIVVLFVVRCALGGSDGGRR